MQETGSAAGGRASNAAPAPPIVDAIVALAPARRKQEASLLSELCASGRLPGRGGTATGSTLIYLRNGGK